MNGRRGGVVVARLLLVCAGSSAPLLGQEAPRHIGIRWDNDILAIRGGGAPADYDYTQGIVVSVEPAGSRLAGRLWPRYPSCEEATESAGCVVSRLEAGQRIYTPRRDAPAPVPGERPYAAWLFVASAATLVEPGRVRSIRVELGITGPPALGEPVQGLAHRLSGSEPQQGWDHQLRFEPGFLLQYEQGRVYEAEAGGLGSIDFRPVLGITVGNVRTGAHLGTALRLGARGERGPVASLTLRQEWVLHDLFLDGNSLRENSLAVKLPFVSQAEAGVGYRFRTWSLTYHAVVRTREYRAQPRPHVYGSISVRFRTWVRG